MTASRPSSQTVYDRITNTLYDPMQRGTLPWVRPWATKLPHNAASGREYSGVNLLSTMAHEAANGYDRSGYLTFNQARQLGGWVRQGERGVLLVLYRQVPKRVAQECEDDDRYFLARGFVVFNVRQCGGLDHLIAGEAERGVHQVEPASVAERVITSSGVTVRYGGAQAQYDPRSDCVTLPPTRCFVSTDAYYSTAFHELAHATGHETRLDRQRGCRFGDPAYAFEELVAELAAAFVAARVGIGHTTQAAAYLQNWLGALHRNPRYIFAASKAASLAANWLCPAGKESAAVDHEPETATA